MCTALYMMVLYDRARVGPTTKTSDEISIICLFRLILQAKSFVLFYLWYSSCFEVKCWFHTFPKRCSHTSMWIPILLDHRDCHANSFQPTCSFQVDPIISTFARSILSSLQRCLLHPTQVAFVFPPSHRCFFKDSDFLIMYPFIDGKSLLLFFQCSYPVISHEDTNGASSLLFFVLFLLRWTQVKLSVLIVFFSSFQMLSHVGASLNHPPLAIHVIWSAEDISEDSHFHSQSVQAISRLLSLLSHLIQPAQSFF